MGQRANYKEIIKSAILDGLREEFKNNHEYKFYYAHECELMSATSKGGYKCGFYCYNQIVCQKCDIYVCNIDIDDDYIKISTVPWNVKKYQICLPDCFDFLYSTIMNIDI